MFCFLCVCLRDAALELFIAVKGAGRFSERVFFELVLLEKWQGFHVKR